MKNARRPLGIVNPTLQGWLFKLLLIAAGVSVLVQTAVMAWTLGRLARSVPEAEEEILSSIPSALLLSAGTTILVMVPIVYLLGFPMTKRLIGPLHRFHGFLRAVVEGRHSEPCHIRDQDLLHDLCFLLNEATEPMRMDSSRAMRGEGKLVSVDSPAAPFAEETPEETTEEKRPVDEYLAEVEANRADGCAPPDLQPPDENA